jgi:aromatic-L-amino-acid decarboxylase
MPTNFDFTKDDRLAAWHFLIGQLETYYADTAALPVAPILDQEEIKKYIHPSFETPLEYKKAIEHVINGLKQFTVHTPHPNYFGLFNPRANFPGILADAITATFNPQLAAWSHAPFAAEVESELIMQFGEKFGYARPHIDGSFTTGGAEANLTATLCALNKTFPDYAKGGLSSVGKKPLIYVSAESHHSLAKAASITGLGLDAIRQIPVTRRLQMDITLLEKQIKEDSQNNFLPLMIVATMGTTGAGAIDPIRDIAHIAATYKVWLHADAAYGGSVVLTRQFKDLLENIHLADSITFDAHKWMSVPMSASMFITRHRNILNTAFRVTTDYMPKEASDLQITDPFTHSIQWSRRFIGLKIYLSLLVFGWDGYEEVIARQKLMGDHLRERLQDSDWIIYNQTRLPIVCFGKKNFETDPDAALSISKKVIGSGKAWISVYKINGVNTLRACITNYASNESHIGELLAILNEP